MAHRRADAKMHPVSLSLRLTAVTVMVYAILLFEPSGVHATIQKCYDKLGCFDNKILNALPQEPAYVRTEFRLSCGKALDNVTLKAVDAEAAMRQTLDTRSCFQASRDTTFVVHGFRDLADSQWVKDIRDFLVTKKDQNVFAVDWRHGAGFLFEQAAANTHLVAKQLAMFVGFLEAVKGLDPHRIHFIGHSLGAHIAGNAGHHLAPMQVARITGLDPAEPYFQQVDDSMRLDASDATFVDVIHTDGETFTGLKGYGSPRSQGHVDFYPNGGERQPGCQATTRLGSLSSDALYTTGCSHGRSHDLFVQSLTSVSCHLKAQPCSSWDAYNNGDCMACSSSGGHCTPMGLNTPSTVRGNLYLSTTDVEPFCGATYLIEVTTTPSQKHAYGSLEVAIQGNATTSNPTSHDNYGFFGGRDIHFHSSETHKRAVAVKAEVKHVKSLTLLFTRGSGLAAIDSSLTLAVSGLNVTSFQDHNSWVFCKGTVFLPSGKPTTVDLVPMDSSNC